MTDAGRVRLQRHEGRNLRAYRCPAGKLTIGYGHNLDAKPISARAADVIFDDDVTEVEAALLAALPWLDTLDPVRRDVLIDMAFNLGVAGLLRFSDTLAKVQGKDYAGAANAMLASAWATQVGKRATTLAAAMKSGKA